MLFWHRRWLGNVYVWAGQYWLVNMGKADFKFAASRQRLQLMEKLDSDILARHTHCEGMPETRQANAISVVQIEFIPIHSFLEGNGRLSRLLVNIMALQAGWPELDFTLWDRNKAAYFSAIQSGLGDDEPMSHLVRQVLRESEGNADA